MKIVYYSKIIRIVLIIMILLIIASCDILLGLDQRKKIGDISSNIIYDGEYVIFCKEYFQDSEPGYYTLGQAMYCVELSTGNISSELIEYENGALIGYGENAPDAYLSKTNSNVYLSSPYLRPPWKYSLNNKTWSEVEDSIIERGFILDYSPDESELIYIEGYEYIYFIDKIANEIKKYGGSNNYDMPISINWDKKIMIYIRSKYLDFVNIGTDSTWQVDLSETVGCSTIKRIKWFRNNILIDFLFHTEILQISYIDSEWQPNGWIDEKYYYMADDSSYCDIMNELHSTIISIYNKNDELMQTIEVREEIEGR